MIIKFIIYRPALTFNRSEVYGGELLLENRKISKFKCLTGSQTTQQGDPNRLYRWPSMKGKGTGLMRLRSALLSGDAYGSKKASQTLF
jgi:hypothetical protein